MRSLEEALSELSREFQVRNRCYDRWVNEGKLSVVEARDRSERLYAAIHYLTNLQQGVTSFGDVTNPVPNGTVP